MDSFLKQHCSKEWQQFVDFHKIIFEFEANSYIFKEGEPVKGLFIVNNGKVKIFSTAEDKKEIIIRLAADGSVIGHRGFGGDWNYPVSAFSYTKTKVTFIPIDIFNILARANTEFTYQLMMFFAEELRHSEEKNNLVPVKNKIAQAILMNFNVFGPDAKDPLKLSFTISRKDYAAIVNTTYETVIRVLSELNKEKVIELEAKSIRISDYKKLVSIANQRTVSK
ncbi:MAG: Transcriptional activator protein Anr [Flavobacteriales bacterium]|nr:Transcriptional activator protein Anr [Flavobacteriales bacterium]